ncbi:MAG: hypothetical protein PHN33_03260 [Candidatus Peribacteraceae bacterium]|nr:hypothetical protein [Candidatus Peribacteraceae bacterium]
MNVLFLTAEEQKAFEALSAKLRDGWEVELEHGDIRDDAAHRAMRLQLLHLHDPTLLAFVKCGSTLNDVDAIVALMSTTTLKNVSDADLAELCFALGPVSLTKILGMLLPKVQTDDELEAVQAIAFVRHSLISAMHPSSTR